MSKIYASMSNVLSAEFPNNSLSTGAWLWSSSILSFISLLISTFNFRNGNRTKELCGNAGGLNYCFTPCDVDHSNNHFIVRDPFKFSCYIYSNGNPTDPSLTPLELTNLLVSAGTFVSSTRGLPQVHEDRICTGLQVGDDTLESIFGTGVSNDNPPFYCLPYCDEFNFQDYETTDNPLPCYIEYHGTMMETLVSRLTRLIEPAVENDKEICPFTGLNDDRNNCRSSISRMCRANRKVRKQNKMA